MIVGNDISSFQGDPNFDTLKDNANFVITKVTEGMNYINPFFARTQEEARRVHLPLGYYHFARPSAGNSPQEEAAFFLTAIGKMKTGEILCLDYEDDYTGDVVIWCKGFLDAVFAQSGVKPLIYLNKSLVLSYNWQTVVDAGYGLWLASYEGDLQTGQWEFAAMQQWTSSQTVPGIAGTVDGDYFFGTVEQFKAYGYIGHSPSSSLSPSVSPSSSPSASLSPSSSASASPSIEPVPEPPFMEQYLKLEVVIDSSWHWIGKNSWYNKLSQLRHILHG